jgi:hypothetical protein
MAASFESANVSALTLRLASFIGLVENRVR